jgi:hypothetical protein
MYNRGIKAKNIRKVSDEVGHAAQNKSAPTKANIIDRYFCKKEFFCKNMRCVVMAAKNGLAQSLFKYFTINKR